MGESVVIVGASLGGLRTAEALRRSAFTGTITVIGDEPHFPYNRPPLSKDFLASRIDAQAVAFPRRPSLSDVSWILGTKAVSADLENTLVTTADGRSHPYDSLVIATGLRPRRLTIPGAGIPGSYALRTLDDAERLRSALSPDARVLVVGAGFIGCEVAATVRGLGCAVTVVGRDAIPLQRPLGAELATELMRRNEGRGVQFRTQASAARILGAHHVEGLELADGSIIECDVVVEAVGSVHNTEWLDGNDIDADAGILTDSGMRALTRGGGPWADVFAVGDVARFPNELFGGPAASIEHWNIPTETAKRAAEVIVAGITGPDALAASLARRFAPIPSFWSDQFDAHLLAYGMLGRADRTELIHGDLHGECVFGYFDGDTLVGVCGIGHRSIVMGYRDRLARPSIALDESRDAPLIPSP